MKYVDQSLKRFDRYFNRSDLFLFFILQEEERRKREDLEKVLAENERKLVDAQKRLVKSSNSCGDFLNCCLFSQADEEEKLRTEQLRLMEDRERFERQMGKQHAKEQNLILGRNKTREKISFSLNNIH